MDHKVKFSDWVLAESEGEPTAFLGILTDLFGSTRGIETLVATTVPYTVEGIDDVFTTAEEAEKAKVSEGFKAFRAGDADLGNIIADSPVEAGAEQVMWVGDGLLKAVDAVKTGVYPKASKANTGTRAAKQFATHEDRTKALGEAVAAAEADFGGRLGNATGEAKGEYSIDWFDGAAKIANYHIHRLLASPNGRLNCKAAVGGWYKLGDCVV